MEDGNESMPPKIIAKYSVHCDQNMFLMHLDTCKTFKWTLTVKSKSNQLLNIERLFLHNSHMPEFSLLSATINNETTIQEEGSQFWENRAKIAIRSASFCLQFMSESYGIFAQDLIFQFVGGIKMSRHIEVQVIPESKLMKTLHFKPAKHIENELVWLEKYEIFPFDGEPQPNFLEAKYPLPLNIEDLVTFGAFDNLEKRLTKENYKERLHLLLHVEEHERRNDLQKLSFTLENIRDFIKEPIPGLHLNRILKVPCDDYNTEQACRVIGKSGKALLKVTDRSSGSCLVFEVLLEQIHCNEFLFEMSEKLDGYLKASSGCLKADICFRFVDVFQYMHSAIDEIVLNDIFPTHSQAHKDVWGALKHENLSKEQSTAFHRMVESGDGPPVLVLGPFGSGKTRTMAAAVIALLKTMLKENKFDKKILICTHSNSAADHYIEDFIDPFLQEEKPNKPILIRMNWEFRYTASVSASVLQYCKVKNGRFVPPSREEIENNVVVVCTLVMADLLSTIGVEKGHFSHIFIDEAAQAMEVEAIIPLRLKGTNTKVVLAGDHLQLGFPLVSETAKNLGLGISLLERLFKEYPAQSTYKLKLLENFRSFQEIVEISSSLFYEGSLIARKECPMGLRYPLRFYGTHGKEELSAYHPSFYNMVEAYQVLKCIKEIMSNWPETLDDLSQSNICVLACFPAQIQEIRLLLRRNSLSGIRVENVNNVQGLEFHVVILSAVRTYTSLSEQRVRDSADVGFFSSPKMFNTAITRARYLCIFVADPVALCSFGACKALWKTLIASCHQRDEFHYRLTYDDVMNLSEKLRATIEENLNQNKKERSLQKVYDYEQQLQQRKESPGNAEAALQKHQTTIPSQMPNSGLGNLFIHCNDSLRNSEYSQAVENSLPASPAPSDMSSVSNKDQQLLHYRTDYPPIASSGDSKGLQAFAQSNPASNVLRDSNIMPLDVIRNHLGTMFQPNPGQHQLLKTNRPMCSSAFLSFLSPRPYNNDTPGTLQSYATCPSSLLQGPSQFSGCGFCDEIEHCNIFTKWFLEHMITYLPNLIIVLQQYKVELEELIVELRLLQNSFAKYPYGFISEKLVHLASIHVNIMTKLEEILLEVLPQPQSSTASTNLFLHSELLKEFVELKLCSEFLCQPRNDVASQIQHTNHVSCHKFHGLVSFVLRQFQNGVGLLLTYHSYTKQTSLCAFKVNFFSNLLQLLKSRLIEEKNTVTLAATGIQYPSVSSHILHSQYAAFGELSPKPATEQRREPSIDVGLLQLFDQSKQNFIIIDPRKNEIDEDALNELDDNFHNERRSVDEFRENDEDGIRMQSVVDELLKLTIDVPLANEDHDVIGLRKLINELRRDDMDVQQWFVDRENDPFVREYIESFERYCATLSSFSHSSSSDSLKSLPKYDMTNKYKMVPAYVPYLPVHEEAINGVMTFDKTESNGEPVGVIMHGNNAVYFKGLRAINRSLDGDLVQYQITGTNGQQKRGCVICVLERKTCSILCKMSLNDHHLMLPFDGRGPPILALNSSASGQLADRLVIGGGVKSFMVRIIGWPLDMRYPLGLISREPTEHIDS